MDTTTKQAARDLIANDSQVRDAVADAQGQSPAPKVATTGRARATIVTALVLLVALVAIRAALRLPALRGYSDQWPILLRLPAGIALACAALVVERVIEIVVVRRVDDPVARYDLERVLRLLLGIVAAGLLVTTVFANWRAAVTSLGLISLIVGFALQTPITSLLAWVYILIKRPFRVGDRISLGGVKGDVIAIGYLDTTLWEFGGEYLTGDHPSGRVVKFPNANVLQTPVWNYSWPAFPFVWNEIKLQVGYDSDLAFVGKVMQDAAQEEIGEAMAQNVRTYREILSATPVDHLEVNEHPSIAVRVADNTWVEIMVRYLVHPKDAGRVKSRLLRTILERLNAEP
jgi:small-conductance mechanosensitive channel